jgi:hypothetical protein
MLYRPLLWRLRLGWKNSPKSTLPPWPFFACPNDFDSYGMNAVDTAEMAARDVVECPAQADAFAAGVPGSRVLRLPHADHWVLRSNGPVVAWEMNQVLATLL